jgi:hypothetical protein
MYSRYEVSQIIQDTITDLNRAHAPILIACIRRDHKFQDQLIILKYIADHFRGGLAVCYALEDVFPYFSEKYSTGGTPTYLILDRGKIMGSILGVTPYYDLIEKVNGILLGHECHTKTAGADHLHYENDPPDSMEEKNRDQTPDDVLQRKQVVE